MEKKCKTIETTVNLLPEPIIQHIQSYLNGKDAARTTLLSKPWYTAWLTRPILDFDQHNFHNKPPSSFKEYTAKTMQRYKDLNLKIECFRLNIKTWTISEPVAHTLIVNAINIGATDLKLDLHSYSICVPREVLESESIITLFLSHTLFLKNSLIRCSRLKSLTIQSLYTSRHDDNNNEDDDVLRNLLSSCRSSIEQLSMSLCSGFKLSRMCPHDELRKLRTLYLENINVDNTFFYDFATRFPCLKELSLVECTGYKRIEMASTSLECIRIVQLPKKRMMDKFDVPNIRKFTYSCTSLPSLNFNKGRCVTTREWEFDLSIKCRHLYASSWFLRLSRFLKRIRPSTIKLSLALKSGPRPKKHDAVDNNNNNIPKRVVLENLMIEVPSEHCSALLGRVFGICCPKSVTHYWLPNGKDNNESLGMLCNVLMSGEQNSFGLKEVNMELYEEILRDEWRPLVLEKPFDASKSPANRHKVRFQLRW